MRTIKTTPGIGDTLWVLQKVLNANEKFDWQLHSGAPQRGRQVFELLPQVTNSCSYVPGLQYNVIKSQAITRMVREWKQIRANEFFLEANSHLESGRRIEEFLPDLPTSFTMPFQTAAWSEEVKCDFTDGPYIGIYASAYNTVRHWNFWDEHGWMVLIQKLANLTPNATFVLIGAEWDWDLARNLLRLLHQNKVKHISTIGKPLGYVVEMMKILTYGFYFPSGLGIICGLLHAPGTMFYSPKDHPNLPRTWCDPKIIADGTFKECFFCTPEQIYQWVRDVYQLKDKL